MLSSLRARLLLCYTLILAVVIATFMTTVSLLYWRSLVADIDRDLRVGATALVAALRPAGTGDFDLDLPVEYRQDESRQVADRRYFAVWNARGDLIDQSIRDIEIPLPQDLAPQTRDGRRELALRAAGGALVLVGRDLAEARRAVWSVAGTATAAGLIALAVSLVGGWFLVGRALAPVRLAMQSQRRFTADASHELRTPLATIAAETEWALSRARSNEDYRDALATCRRAAERTRRIVEQLLTLARGDGAELELRRVPVGLAPVVSDALAVIRPLAQQKHVTIETRLDEATVTGDPDRLTDLVTNLCANAVAYNREGGSVCVEVWPEGGDACVRVRDTGIGISADDLPRVFDRFYRADKARTARGGGAGLGLAIAKWIVEAHGGRIVCDSTAGQGTEVLVRLPRAV